MNETTKAIEIAKAVATLKTLAGPGEWAVSLPPFEPEPTKEHRLMGLKVGQTVYEYEEYRGILSREVAYVGDNGVGYYIDCFKERKPFLVPVNSYCGETPEMAAELYEEEIKSDLKMAIRDLARIQDAAKLLEAKQ